MSTVERDDDLSLLYDSNIIKTYNKNKVYVVKINSIYNTLEVLEIVPNRIVVDNCNMASCIYNMDTDN